MCLTLDEVTESSAPHSGYCYYLHFLDGETEAQRGPSKCSQSYLLDSGSHNWHSGPEGTAQLTNVPMRAGATLTHGSDVHSTQALSNVLLYEMSV